jgi:hypothetical protein
MTRPADELLKIQDETVAYVPPSVPPPASDSATTDVWEPVRFFDLPTPPKFRADLPLPLSSQHVRTLIHESYDATIDRTVSTPAPSSGVTTQAPTAPVAGNGGASRAVGATACLLALSGCSADDRAVVAGFVLGAASILLVVLIEALADWDEP